MSIRRYPQMKGENRMKRVAHFAGSVVHTGVGLVVGLIAGIVAGGLIGVGIAMLFHVL